MPTAQIRYGSSKVFATVCWTKSTAANSAITKARSSGSSNPAPQHHHQSSKVNRRPSPSLATGNRLGFRRNYGNRRRSRSTSRDEVRLQADIVWFVINAIDGRVFVCGSTKGMGEGVERALIDVAMDKGNLDYETARQFWNDKQGAGQYIAETW